MSTSTVDGSLASRSRLRRWLTGLAVTAAVIVAIYYAVNAFISIYTKALWFHSVQDGTVYGRELVTQIVLFAIFGGLAGVTVAANLILVVRRRPNFTPHPVQNRWRGRYLTYLHPWRRWLLAVITIYVVVKVGSIAAGNWQTWLQWRNATSFGVKDPQFHRDVSYFLFVYPMHRLVITLLFRIVATTLFLVLVTAYLYGGVRLRGRRRLTGAVTGQLSLLLAAYLLLKAFAYWLDRLALATSNRGVVTGPGYTDVHAVLPDKMVLLIVAAVAAALLLANAYLRQPRLILLGIGGMAVAAFLLGIAVPQIVQQFRVKPSASTLELPYIARNIQATRSAFGVSSVTAQQFARPTASVGSLQLLSEAGLDQIRLLDPNVFNAAFTAKQQLESYYGFKSTLDVDRYPIDGQDQDVLLAVRELQQSGLPNSQRTWTNNHLVYTHGYGVVAARTNTVDGGEPSFVEKNLPPTGSLPAATNPGIYYGQQSPGYSIVGGKAHREFNLPSSAASGDGYTTHVGGGGISIGSRFRRLVYAVKYGSPSILLSKEITGQSQLLTIRNPRSRVAAVAPWLTLDGDVYPVISGGHILWVVDGYTTASNYPYSQSENLRSATSTTLSQNGSTVTQSGSSVNYIRNSVKATVDAYTGQVTLYAWNQSPTPDPVLETWEKAFPGLVKPQSDIPADLLPHLRYPQDLFNLQRYVLTQYHVTNAQSFYAGSNFWRVPNDPNVASTTTKNSIGRKVSVGPPTQPSTYMTLSAGGGAPPSFALSSDLVSLNRRNLTSFLSVDSQPGPNYGHFTLLQIPVSQETDGPSQIRTDIENDSSIQQEFSLLRNPNSRLILGNLITVPIDGQMLNVEPVYTQSTSTNSFPNFKQVIAIYGSGTPVISSTLDGALAGAFSSSASAPAGNATP